MSFDEVEYDYPLNVFNEEGFQPVWLSKKIRLLCKFVTLRDNETCYIYRPELGIYSPNGESEIRRLASNMLRDASRQRRVNETVFHVKISTYRDRAEFQSPLHLVPLANGVLDVTENPYVLTEYNPEYYFTFKLPIEYNPSAHCPQFLTFLEEVVPNRQSRVQIQELFGYLLVRHYRYQIAFMFVGEGWNGKSTLIAVMKAFLGKDNITSVSLHDLAANRFALANLYQKLANLYADISSSALKDTGIFKLLTGGDPITAEQKFKNPFQFVNHAKLIFSANQIPYTRDDSVAFFRRWIIINFPNKFSPELGNCDPAILEKITTPEELSGILNWALVGLARLEQNGHFSHMNTDQENRDLYLRLSSSLYSFVQDCVQVMPKSEIPKDEFYREYTKYCIENKCTPLSKNLVTKSLPRFVPSISETRPKIENRQVYCWHGIFVLGTEMMERKPTEEEVERFMEGTGREE